MTQFCSEPGCPALVPSGKCARHAPRQRLEHPAARQVHRWYTSTRWQRLRAEVIQDEPLCRHCRLTGRHTPTVDVDHIRRHDGDPLVFWDRRNLQGLCKRCHTIKTTRGE